MMSFQDQLHACHERLVSVCAALPAPYPAFTLFFSVSDGSQRAHVVHARAADFETAWREGSESVGRWVRERGIVSPWLRRLPLADHGLRWISPPASAAHPLDGSAGAEIGRAHV